MADEQASKPLHEEDFKITVNSREEVIAIDVLTYDVLVKLAFDPVPTNKDITVSYRDAAGPKEQGSLLPNESVTVKRSGTTFIVTATNKA